MIGGNTGSIVPEDAVNYSWIAVGTVVHAAACISSPVSTERAIDKYRITVGIIEHCATGILCKVANEYTVPDSRTTGEIIYTTAAGTYSRSKGISPNNGKTIQYSCRIQLVA